MYVSAFCNERIVLLAASRSGAVESLAVFESLGSVDAEHGSAKHGVQLAELWFADAFRTVLHHASHYAADGVAFRLHLTYKLLHALCGDGVGAAHGVAFCLCKVVLRVVAVESHVAHLRCVCVYAHSKLA